MDPAYFVKIFPLLTVSGKPHHSALIVYSRVSQPTGHGRIFDGSRPCIIEIEYVLQVNSRKRWLLMSCKWHNTLSCDYAFGIIAIRKFQHSLPRCPQYAVTEDILRQTGSLCCHENEIWKQD